jgi:hypothetical protein
MYLVCHGANARPEYQIKVVAERQVEKEYFNRRKKQKEKKTVTERDYAMGSRSFRTVYDGRKKNPQTGKSEKVFSWQECVGKDADGEDIWRTVKCWSHIVFADVAESLGYEVRCDEDGEWERTEAFEGDRAVGSEHTVEAEADNAMVELARAALSDEEAGLVAPSPEVDPAEEAEAEQARVEAEIQSDVDAEDRLDAESMGLTLEQYRKLLAENS